MLFEKQILNNIDKWIPIIIPHIIDYLKKNLEQRIEEKYNQEKRCMEAKLVTYINDKQVTEVVLYTYKDTCS